MVLAGLCHMAFETPQRIPKPGVSPKSPDRCVPELFSICQGLSGGPGGPVSPGAYQLNLPKMKGNYFLNPRNYFLNPGNYFLNIS